MNKKLIFDMNPNFWKDLRNESKFTTTTSGPINWDNITTGSTYYYEITNSGEFGAQTIPFDPVKHLLYSEKSSSREERAMNKLLSLLFKEEYFKKAVFTKEYSLLAVDYYNTFPSVNNITYTVTNSNDI